MAWQDVVYTVLREEVAAGLKTQEEADSIYETMEKEYLSQDDYDYRPLAAKEYYEKFVSRLPEGFVISGGFGPELKNDSKPH